MQHEDIPPAQAAAEQQQAEPLYTCSVCGEPVLVYGGRTFRTCEHLDAAVNANLSAIVKGTSGIQ